MKSKTLACIILFTLSFIFYGNSISNKYALDDLIVITGNSFTQEGFKGLKDIFTNDAFVGAYGGALKLTGGRYRPLSIASFAIEKEIFGYKTNVFHFFNVFFFALTVVLIFLLLSRLFSSKQMMGGNINYNLPFISALLFLILPVHTEVVANIKSRDEIFALLFSLITFFLLLPKTVIIKSAKSGKAVKEPDLTKSSNTYLRILIAALFFFLALLSKENAITFLALIPLALFMFTNEKVSRIILKASPLVLVAIFYIILRAKFAGIIGDRETTDIMDNPYVYATSLQKFFTIALIQLRYLGLVIFPYELSYDYSFNQIPLVNPGNLLSIFSILIHVALFIFAIIFFRKNKIVSYFIFFYFITFSIVSNLFFNIGTSMAERFIYMPSLGLCVLIAYGLIRLLKVDMTGNPVLKGVPVTVILLIVFLSGTQTIARNKDWYENYTLFKKDVDKVPMSARAQLYYGIECYKKYEVSNNPAFVDTSVARMKRSADINPKFYYAWLNLGVVYEHTGRFNEALSSYERAVSLEPELDQGWYGLGYIYGKELNQPEKAISYFLKLINRTDKPKPEYYEGIGNCYTALGKLNEAIRFYKIGLSKFPDAPKLYFNAGVAYENLQKYDSSEFYLNKAFALDPSLK